MGTPAALPPSFSCGTATRCVLVDPVVEITPAEEPGGDRIQEHRTRSTTLTFPRGTPRHTPGTLTLTCGSFDRPRHTAPGQSAACSQQKLEHPRTPTRLRSCCPQHWIPGQDLRHHPPVVPGISFIVEAGSPAVRAGRDTCAARRAPVREDTLACEADIKFMLSTRSRVVG